MFLLLVLGFGDPTKGMTRIWGHFVILDECDDCTWSDLKKSLDDIIKMLLNTMFVCSTVIIFKIENVICIPKST